MKRLLIAAVVLAALGVAVSSYALWQHFAPLGAAFCTLSESFSCDIVNKSAYSEIVGIPVALIGIVGYLGIAAASIGAMVDVRRRARWVRWGFVVVALGAAFQMVFTYIEVFTIGAICPICILSQAFILAILTLFGVAAAKVRVRSSTGHSHATW